MVAASIDKKQSRASRLSDTIIQDRIQNRNEQMMVSGIFANCGRTYEFLARGVFEIIPLRCPDKRPAHGDHGGNDVAILRSRAWLLIIM
jgi:hypothetical protein